MGLSIYSCSELILPKQVRVKGTVNLPIRAGAANLNEILKEELEKAFPADANEDGQKSIEDIIQVHNVNYPGQTVQTFFIYLPFEMTEDLNPNSFLKEIDKQIIKDMATASTPIKPTPPIRAGMPVAGLNLIDIPPIKFTEIAQYVKIIDFDPCEDNESTGIGLSFYFDEIPLGLNMRIDCDELDIHATKPLKPCEKIIFGNNGPVSLNLEMYEELTFNMSLQLENGSDFWIPDHYNIGDEINITGQMHFFREWTKAKINLTTAINKFSKFDENTGKFPKDAFSLSRLGNYFDGGFEFSDELEVKIYIECSGPNLIKDLGTKLVLRAMYTDGPGNEENKLYDAPLVIPEKPINMDDYINEKDNSYNREKLPKGDEPEDDDQGIKKEIVKGIFQKMPEDLHFLFNIEVTDKEEDGTDKLLTITRADVENTDKANVIKTTMMILLPMTLIAEGNVDGTRSAILLPDMLGKDDDLFGREEPKELFSKGEIEYIKMSIDFANPIFNGGHLFIKKDDESKEDVLFPPDGILLNNNRTELKFTKYQFDIIEEKLIIPSIRIEIDNGGRISVPKNMAVINITVEMKGLINLGDL